MTVSKPPVLRRSSRILGQEDSDLEIIENAEDHEDLTESVHCVGEMLEDGDIRLAERDEVEEVEVPTDAGDGVEETEGRIRTEIEVMETVEIPEGVDGALHGKHACLPCGMIFR